MNEHVALHWPKLTLARELPFSLAGTQVRPAALEVETDGKVTTLEPRVMKVLVALHRSRGQPVSRDVLIDLCWEGRIVTEGALNRCVAQLRKALSLNPRIRLDTIPTVGYRLQASAEVRRVAPAGGEPVLPVTPSPGRVLPWTWPSAAAAVGVAIAAAVAFWPRPASWTADSFRPLTAERGVETHPALSPDGDQIAYAQRPGPGQGRDLFLRSVDQGTPIRITSHPHDEFSPAWSPRGDRIAFVRTPPVGPCSLVVVPAPQGPERTVGRCQAATYTRVSWLNEQTLVIGDRPSDASPWRIRAIDVATGAARDLTSPDPSTLGDGDPWASPDGRHVVFRRTLLHGADDLYLKDLRTGRERALTTDGWKAAGYVWSGDGRHIFYSSNRGGAFGLWTLDTRSDRPPQRVSLGFGQISFSRMSIDRRNRLAVEIPRGRINIAALTPDGAVQPITNAAGSDWEPDAAVDGAVAYTSNRTGPWELWATLPSGQELRLTSILGSYIHSPAWAPDGQRIAFVAVKGRKAEIYTVARDGSQLRTLTSDGRDKIDPVWAPAGDRLFYLERTATGRRLMQLSLAPGASPEPLGAPVNWRSLRRAPDGRLIGVTADGVVQAPTGSVPQVRLRATDEWAVGREGVYVLSFPRGAAAVLTLHPWTGPPRRLLESPSMDGGLAVAADGRVLFSQSLDDQVDLGLIELRS